MTGAVVRPERPRLRRGFRRAAITAFILLLPAAAYSVWDYIEARRLSRAVEDVRSRGERVHFGEAGEGRPITPEQKRASRYYGAAAILATDAYSSRFEEAARTIEALASLSAAEAKRDPRRRDLRRLIESYAPALDLLDRASVLDTRGIEYGSETRFGFPNRALANVNAVRIADLALARDPRAADALLATLRIRRAYTDASALTLPVRTSGSLRLVLTLAPPDEHQLQRLQAEYAAAESDEDVERRLIGLRAQLIAGWWPGAFGELPTLPRIRVPFRGESLTLLIMRPWLTNRITRELRAYEEVLRAARQPWPAKLNSAREFAERYPTRPALSGASPGLSQRLLGWPSNLGAREFGRMAPAVADRLAEKRASMTAVAVERYRRSHGGALPSGLSALVPVYLADVPRDPFTGEPLRYLSGPGQYKVYSLGPNLRDDGGEVDATRSDLRTYRRGEHPADVGVAVGVRR